MLYKVRRKLLSQNFLYSRTLVSSLVRRSYIGQNDTVLEIGPGKGFITVELLKVAKKVIAIELDEKLVLHIKQHHILILIFVRQIFYNLLCRSFLIKFLLISPFQLKVR